MVSQRYPPWDAAPQPTHTGMSRLAVDENQGPESSEPPDAMDPRPFAGHVAALDAFMRTGEIPPPVANNNTEPFTDSLNLSPAGATTLTPTQYSPVITPHHAADINEGPSTPGSSTVESKYGFVPELQSDMITVPLDLMLDMMFSLDGCTDEAKSQRLAILLMNHLMQSAPQIHTSQVFRMDDSNRVLLRRIRPERGGRNGLYTCLATLDRDNTFDCCSGAGEGSARNRHRTGSDDHRKHIRTYCIEGLKEARYRKNAGNDKATTGTYAGLDSERLNKISAKRDEAIAYDLGRFPNPECRIMTDKEVATLLDRWDVLPDRLAQELRLHHVFVFSELYVHMRDMLCSIEKYYAFKAGFADTEPWVPKIPNEISAAVEAAMKMWPELLALLSPS